MSKFTIRQLQLAQPVLHAFDERAHVLVSIGARQLGLWTDIAVILKHTIGLFITKLNHSNMHKISAQQYKSNY